MSTKIKFADLTDESKVLKITAPIFTPVTKNPDDETVEQLMARHEKFLALPELIKDKLANIKIARIIQQIGKVYNLELLQLADISRAIRSYYFGELKLEDFSFVLAKEMNIDLTKAKQIFQVIKEKIIDDQSYERALQANLISLPLSEALRIHPEIGEQLITSSKINLRNFPYPVRPSIKNWLADYTFQLGYEKHESMARSQYLFQGANTKNLPNPEKQKLAFLLKSFDENSPVTVNKNTKQVIFPTSTPPSNSSTENRLPKNLSDQFRPIATPPQTEQKNINSMQFSYRQTLPYEKTLAPSTPVKPEPWKIFAEKKLASPAPVKTLPSEIPVGNRSAERISQGKDSAPQNLPKNIVDLKNIDQ